MNNFSKLAKCCIDELNKITESYELRISALEAKISELEKQLAEEASFQDEKIVESINCPYCGYEFNVEYDETENETTCPKCNNLIELDWGEFEDDM